MNQRQADLYTKEGAAIAAEKKAAKFAKKMEKEGKESAGGGDGGGKVGAVFVWEGGLVVMVWCVWVGG